MKKIIATHNKFMHADEVTAIALLKVFTDDEIIVERINHNTIDYDKYDMVIDMGRKFDGVKYFDHHQNIGGKSSAGLIWEYLGLENDYPKITKLIDLIDKNDVGIQKAEPFEYANLIKCFNIQLIHSEEQEHQFHKAVEFAQTILISMKNMQEEKYKAEDIVKNSTIFNHNAKILELQCYTPHWSSYINADINAHIKAVVWNDKIEDNWKVRVPSLRCGSFELNGNPLPPDSSMEFVHNSGHFAIAKSEQQMNVYLEKCI